MKIFRFSHIPILIVLIAILMACKSNPTLTEGEGYIEVTGGKIWYHIIGEGNETPILFLHGGPGGTSKSFYNFAELSVDRPVILFDQLGSGRSDYHTDTTLMTVEIFVEQLEQLKNALNLKEYYLYGHSWGGLLGLAYYLEHPEHMKSLIFGSPLISTPLWISDADTLLTSLHDSLQSVIQISIKNGDFNSIEYLQAESVFYDNFILRTSRIKSKYDTVPKESNRTIYKYMWGPSEFISTGTLKNYDLSNRLSEIEIPTLFITGEFDEARPSTVKSFQSQVPNSEFVVIEGAGHATMHDNLKDNINAIKDFIDKIEDK